jgi:hypothetical protein
LLSFSTQSQKNVKIRNALRKSRPFAVRNIRRSYRILAPTLGGLFPTTPGAITNCSVLERLSSMLVLIGFSNGSGLDNEATASCLQLDTALDSSHQHIDTSSRN